jgi:hypothetical protein
MKKAITILLILAAAVLGAYLLIQPKNTKAQEAHAAEPAPEATQAPEIPAPAPSQTAGKPTPAPTFPAKTKLTAPPQPPMGSAAPTGLTWTPATAKEATTTAASFMKTMATPTTRSSKTAFMEALGPLMTDNAKTLWTRADPTKLQLRTTTGTPTLENPGTNPYWVWATITANDGTWRLHLHRTPTAPNWKIDSIQPPQPR